MFSASSLLTSVAVSLSITASLVTIRDNAPNANLSFTMILDLSGARLPDMDRARIAHSTDRGKQMDGAKLDYKDMTLAPELSNGHQVLLLQVIQRLTL